LAPQLYSTMQTDTPPPCPPPPPPSALSQAVGRLEAQVEDLQQELEHERTLHAQQQAGAVKAQAELEVQLAVSKASHKALQQVCTRAYSLPRLY